MGRMSGSDGQMPRTLQLRVLREQVWEVERVAGLQSGGGALAEVHGALRDLAAAVAALLGAEIERTRGAEGDRDREAMDGIQAALSGREWNSDTLSEVAEIVRRTGREIAEVGEDEPTAAARREWVYREAHKVAAQGIDVAVGWQINDTTGERELGYCPVSAAGPAFVVDIVEVIPGRPREAG
jgi:hypothetical protein